MSQTDGVRRVGFLFVVAACGTNAVAPAPDASVEDATVSDGPTFGDAGWSPPDVGSPLPPWWDAGVEDGGGLFLCFGCVCDGRTHYCDTGSGPGAPIPDDASACPDAEGWSQCTPLPDGCAPATCSCLLPEDPGLCRCEHSDSGDGLNAGCVYP